MDDKEIREAMHLNSVNYLRIFRYFWQKKKKKIMKMKKFGLKTF